MALRITLSPYFTYTLFIGKKLAVNNFLLKIWYHPVICICDLQLSENFFYNGPFTPNHIGWPSDGHRIAIGWTFYRMGSVPNFFNGWNLFLKDSINEHRFESFYAHFILFLLCCVIYFPLLTWHFQSSLNLISILSESDVCECCIVLYRNPFCPMAIRCPSDEKYFWCEGAIKR